MTSNGANSMDSVKSLPQLRNNPSVKLASASASASRWQPSRKVSKTCSVDSIKSTATETTQVVKVLRFSKKTCSTRKTLSRKDYTLEETEASWSSLEDRQQILRQCHKEIKKIDRGEKFKDKKYCARGLEGRTKIGSVLKAQTRVLAMDAVLEEQFSQWNEGVVDADAIADAYHIASSSCQLWAHIVGRRDHRAAEEIHGSLLKKASAPHYHAHFEQGARKRSDDEGLEQSLAAPCAA
jgi:hypothetical protein